MILEKCCGLRLANRTEQFPAIDESQHQRVNDDGVIPASAKFWGLNRGDVEGGQGHPS